MENTYPAGTILRKRDRESKYELLYDNGKVALRNIINQTLYNGEWFPTQDKQDAIDIGAITGYAHLFIPQEEKRKYGRPTNRMSNVFQFCTIW